LFFRPAGREEKCSTWGIKRSLGGGQRCKGATHKKRGNSVKKPGHREQGIDFETPRHWGTVAWKKQVLRVQKMARRLGKGKGVEDLTNKKGKEEMENTGGMGLKGKEDMNAKNVVDHGGTGEKKEVGSPNTRKNLGRGINKNHPKKKKEAQG